MPTSLCHVLVLAVLSISLSASAALADGMRDLPVVDLIPVGDQLDANPRLYGQNTDISDWHGAIVTQQPPFFIDPKTGKPDPVWEPLTHAFPFHQMRLNTLNKYLWKDGIGPVAERKSIKHDVWNLYYRTEAGLDEYLRWLETLPGKPEATLVASPLLPVEYAADLVAYCNATKGPMAKLRAANGHPKPYNVMIWEMGNEADGELRGDLGALRPDTEEERKQRMRAEDYLALVEPRIKAMRAVDPRIRIFVHTATPPWYFDNPTWFEWHREIIKKLGSQIDGVVIHPYYDGYSVPTCLRSLDKLIADVTELAPPDKKLTVWVNEHARWMSQDHWELTWSLQGAISTGDWIIELIRRPQVEAANYWCYGHRGPWRVISEDSGMRYGTAIFELYRVLNEVTLPRVQPLNVDHHDFTELPVNYSYAVNCVEFADPKTGRLSLFAINRSPDQSFMLRFKLGSKESMQVRRMCVTGAALDATNVPETPSAVTTSETLLVVTPDADGNAKLELPARSVTGWVISRIGNRAEKGSHDQGPL